MTGSVVGVKAQSDAESGAVVVARVEDQVTPKRNYRMDERHLELRPQSSNPEHQRKQIDLEETTFEVVGIALGALIGMGSTVLVSIRSPPDRAENGAGRMRRWTWDSSAR